MSQALPSRPFPLKFPPPSGFRQTLQQRVQSYFERTGLSQRDQLAMYAKIATILAWTALSYGVLVFAPVPLWGRLLAAVSVGFAASGIGFSIMHDAGHGALSSRPKVNRLWFYTLDLLGASSHMWNVKHNQLHHTYTNIDRHDTDFDIGKIARLSPDQAWHWFHRYQHLYMWPLYGVFVIKWQLFDDFKNWIEGRIGDHKVRRPAGWDAIAFVIGKLVFGSLAFAIPMIFYDVTTVLCFYLLITAIQGVTLAVVFQLAHVVDTTEWPTPDSRRRLHEDWAAHQVRTTVDFAPNNRLLGWYLGGLNYQIEHHLFPRISHVHYPALASIVASTCREYGLSYHVEPTFRAGVRSHYRHLRQLGRNPREHRDSAPQSGAAHAGE